MSNESLRQVSINGLPSGFIAMGDAKTEQLPDDVLAVSTRLVITDPAGKHHAMILQFFVDGNAPAGDHGQSGSLDPDRA